MVMVTNEAPRQTRALFDAIKEQCFPMSDGISPAEIRVMRKVVDLEGLPIELTAQAYYEWLDGAITHATIRDIRKYYLAESDYQYYLGRFDDNPFEVRISKKDHLFYTNLLYKRHTLRNFRKEGLK